VDWARHAALEERIEAELSGEEGLAEYLRTLDYAPSESNERSTDAAEWNDCLPLLRADPRGYSERVAAMIRGEDVPHHAVGAVASTILQLAFVTPNQSRACGDHRDTDPVTLLAAASPRFREHHLGWIREEPELHAALVLCAGPSALDSPTPLVAGLEAVERAMGGLPQRADAGNEPFNALYDPATCAGISAALDATRLAEPLGEASPLLLFCAHMNSREVSLGERIASALSDLRHVYRAAAEGGHGIDAYWHANP
jgi:hypothetical protein